jgi:hypothetical protein
MQAHSRLQTSIYLALAAIVLCACGIAVAGHGVPQGGCSPLAGPCGTNRMTYGYFPTKWRRWPTAHLAMTPAMPEEVPTPALDLDDTEPADSADSAEPAPTFDSDLPPALPDDLPAPGESAVPSEAPITAPPFGDMPGGEPGPSPQGGAEPPFGDMPALPSDQGTPSPAAPGAQPPADIFQAPESGPTPAMPQDDPFRDDPEPAPSPGGSSSGSSTSSSAEVASQPALIPALDSLPPDRYAAPVETQPVEMRPVETRVVEARPVMARREQEYQPRLLSPAEEVGEHVPLPPEKSPLVNPIRPERTTATMIRQTSLAPAEAPSTAVSRPLEQRSGPPWRTNPLRAR